MPMQVAPCGITPRQARTGPARRAAGAAFVAAVAFGLAPSEARAYPSSVAFVPHAQPTPFGRVVLGGFAMASVRPEAAYAFGVVSAQAGLLPSFALGPGVRFGGLEADVDYYEAPGAANQLAGNAKLGLLAEGAWWPSLAVGLMGFAPGAPVDLSFGYAVASRSLGERGAYGRFTLGFVRSFAPGARTAPGCVARRAPCALRGTIPFEDENFALLAGYELTLGRFTFGVDHFGGASPFSTTNAQVSVAPSGAWSGSLGVWVTHDRRGEPVDGLYAAVSFGFDLALPD